MLGLTGGEGESAGEEERRALLSVSERVAGGLGGGSKGLSGVYAL